MKNTGRQAVVVSISLIASVAMADELPLIAAPANQAEQAQAPRWTGCRIGGNLGWADASVNQDLSMAGEYLSPDNLFSDPNNNAKLNHSYKTSASGGTGGVGAGCDYQSGNLVWGFEADLNGSRLKKTTQASYPEVGPMPPMVFTNAAPHTETTTFELPWFTTLRGRVGTTVDRFLIYATGGLAYGQIKSSTAVDFEDTTTAHFLEGLQHRGSASEKRLGWTAGLGAEWAANRNWSVKAEYLYVDFGKFSYTSPNLIVPPGKASDTWNTTVDATQNIFRMAVYYRFDN